MPTNRPDPALLIAALREHNELLSDIATLLRGADGDKHTGDFLRDYNTVLKHKVQRLKNELAEKDKQLAAAVEDIKSPSVCERCVRCSRCQGDDICIDNGYMDFEWRGPQEAEVALNGGGEA